MKGIFYSAITILFITPLILFTLTYLNSAEVGSRSIATKTLGDKLASYSDSISTDLPGAMGIISERGTDSAIKYVDASGQPLDNAENRLLEVMTNGTLYGNITLQTFTFNSWIFQMQSKGDAFGFSTNIRLINMTIKPLDSYHMKLDVIIFVNASSGDGKMNLERVYDSAIDVPVQGYLDPLYTLKTNGLLKRTINPVNYTVTGIQNTDNFVGSGMYKNSTSGPSFLDRLEGRLSIASKYQNYTNIGLETIVNFPELQANGFTVKTDQSSVDYLYFDAAVQSGSPVNNTAYNWLRLDNAHGAEFGVTLI